jgi:hypothetical protein
MGENCILSLIHWKLGYVMWDLEVVMLMTVKNTVTFLLPDKDIIYFLHILNMLFIHIFTFGLFLRFCRLLWSDSCDFKIYIKSVSPSEVNLIVLINHYN